MRGNAWNAAVWRVVSVATRFGHVLGALSGLVCVAVVLGCGDRANVIELHFASEVEGATRVDFVIDSKAGVKPKKVASHRYRIDVVEGEPVVLPSQALITHWHQWELVTPSRRYTQVDFTTVDGAWHKPQREEALPGGGVMSTSEVEGSQYSIEFRLLDHETGRDDRRGG
jgi:hypothetical protein